MLSLTDMPAHLQHQLRDVSNLAVDVRVVTGPEALLDRCQTCVEFRDIKRGTGNPEEPAQPP